MDASAPALAVGIAVTVTAKGADVEEQVVELPSVTVYEILVVPGETGVTTPELFTVATPVFVEAQT